jgi:uncharacterized membrane protein
MAMSIWGAAAIFLAAILAFGWLAVWLGLRWWPSFWLRAGLLMILLVALTQTSQGRADKLRPEFLVVDVSDSIEPSEKEGLLAAATDWQQMRQERQVIVFASQADMALSGQSAEIVGSGSSLISALELIEAMGTDEATVNVVTDGRVKDLPMSLAALNALEQAGHDVQLIRLEGIHDPGDVMVKEIRANSLAWSGLPIPAVVTVTSYSEQSAMLRIEINGSELPGSATEVTLGKGENLFPVELPPHGPGILEVAVSVTNPDDSISANNTRYQTIRVFSPPAVLFVTGNLSAARETVSQLRSEGVQVEVISPDAFPTEISALEAVQMVILHDLLAQDLSLEQMKATELFILEEGKGVLFLGGRSSFTLGGYQESLLAPLLPVRLVPPTRIERVPVSFFLVLDRSGSMAGDRNTEIAPIDLMKEGAVRAIETLRPEDQFGVLTFSATYRIEVPVGPIGDGLSLRDAQDKISQIQAAGGTLMFQSLEAGIEHLAANPATEHLHILLLSDGNSDDGSQDEFAALVQNARDAGITISTIALGLESDSEQLKTIAALGEGRFYQVFDPLQLPQVLISESRAIQAENVQLGFTNLVPGEGPHPILFGLNEPLPGIGGYIALQSKEDAENVLVSGNFGDPVLAVWRVGLGHTGVWTTDLGEEWAPQFQNWQEQGTLWTRTIQYMLPDPTIGEPDVQVMVGEFETTVSLEMEANEIRTLDLASLQYRYLDEEGQGYQYPILQTGPERFEATFPTPDTGTYAGMISLNLGGESDEIPLPFEVNYPDEWLYPDPAESWNRIQTFAEEHGIEVVHFGQIIAEEDLPEIRTDWFSVLAGLLVISWPIEIAIRRWKMPWRRP